jgi:hypothetical protein
MGTAVSIYPFRIVVRITDLRAHPPLNCFSNYADGLSPRRSNVKIGVAVAVACVWTVAGLAQFSGTWDLALTVLPGVAFQETRLELIYAFYETWEASLVAYWDATPMETLTLRLKGSLGGVYFTGEAWFDLLSPAYKSAQATATGVWEEISITWGVTHWAPPYAPSRPCLQTGASYLEYRLEVTWDQGSALIRFEDCCSGTMWRDLLLTLREVGLCCGVTGEASLRFSKEAGFEELNFALRDLTLCPGCFAFDLAVEFTADGKSISMTPKLDFPEDFCFTLYGEVESGPGPGELEGLRIQGLRILCGLNDCQEVEFKTAFAPGTLGFTGDEFEYIKVRTCLPGCCGGDGTLETRAYFSSSGGQFGLSRVTVAAEVPLGPGFTVWADGELPATGGMELELGWEVRF